MEGVDHMSMAKHYRMFTYPKKVFSITGSILDTIWSHKIDRRVSQAEFYENGYTGSNYPEGPSCGEILGHVVFKIICSAITISLAVGVVKGAFIIGAILDGLELLINSLNKQSGIINDATTHHNNKAW